MATVTPPPVIPRPEPMHPTNGASASPDITASFAESGPAVFQAKEVSL